MTFSDRSPVVTVTVSGEDGATTKAYVVVAAALTATPLPAVTEMLYVPLGRVVWVVWVSAEPNCMVRVSGPDSTTVYDSNARPPSRAGAVHVTVMLPDVVDRTEVIVGAVGATAVTVMVFESLAEA